MKHRYLLPLLSVLVLLGAAAAAVFGMGYIAEQEWQAPDSSPAPVVNDTAIEQVESELKAYPYQVLTLSAAQILYKEIAQAGEQLTVRETGGDSITAAKAAALAGELAMTLYGSDLSEKTLDLLPVFWQPYGTSDTLALWLAAYTLPEVSQTAPDGSASTITQGCWLFVLDAADGDLLYSHCTALEVAMNEEVYTNSDLLLSDEEMLTLYNRSLALAEDLGLTPTAFYGVETLDTVRGAVEVAYLKVGDNHICRMIFDKLYQTDSLYSIAVAPSYSFSQSLFNYIPVPMDSDWVWLPLTPRQFTQKDLPSAVALAAQGDYSLAGKSQSASYSAADDVDAAYVNSYSTFAERDFLLYRFDPTTSKRSLLCTNKDCTHRPDAEGCTARTGEPFLCQIFAGGGSAYSLPYDSDGRRNVIGQVYPTTRTIYTFTDTVTGHITSAVADRDTIYAMHRTGDETVANGPLRYGLYRIDAVSGNAELLELFPHDLTLIGRLGNYLLFSMYTNGNTVIETEAGLQPHDAGWRDMLFALDLSTNALNCIYDGREDDHNYVDIKTGRLWRAQWTPAGLHVIGQDLFTGKTLPIASGFFLPDDTPSNSLTHMEAIGNYLILRQWSDYKELYHMFDTSTGRLTQLALTDSHSSPAIIAVFGDEALVQMVSGNEHKYFYLSLPALFEGRVERRWVTDDFVLG